MHTSALGVETASTAEGLKKDIVKDVLGLRSIAQDRCPNGQEAGRVALE
jgi:hypothetical protein